MGWIIVPLAFALLVFLRVISEINSGAGVPSEDYQKHVEQDFKQKRWNAAKAMEYQQRQLSIREQIEMQNRADYERQVRDYDSDLGWKDGKWFWD